MKPFPIFALMLGLVLSLCSNTAAHMGERLYPIIELTDADLALIDLHDGSTDDWLAVLGEPTMTAIDFVGPYDPSDYDFRIWMAWHDATNRVYVAMERADDTYVNYYDLSASVRENPYPWTMSVHDSSISFVIDGDHGGGIYFANPCCGTAEAASQYGVHAQPYTAIGELTNGGGSQVTVSHLVNFGDWGDWYILPPYAEGGGSRFGENPVVTITEFYVTPFDRMLWDNEEGSLISDLSQGRTIGFFVGVQDNDEGYAAGNQRLGLPTKFSAGSANNFADGFLLGPGGALPEEEDTAVESVSWGRIKATFR